MFFHGTVVIVAAAFVALLAMACGPAPAPQTGAPAAEPGGEPKRGGTIRFYMRGDPQGGFEPHIPGGRRDTRKVLGLAVQNAA